MRHEELRDMRHDHFLNLTCDIGVPLSRARMEGGDGILGGGREERRGEMVRTINGNSHGH